LCISFRCSRLSVEARSPVYTTYTNRQQCGASTENWIYGFLFIPTLNGYSTIYDSS